MFEFLSLQYKNGLITKERLKASVQKLFITADEYFTITNEVFDESYNIYEVDK